MAFSNARHGKPNAQAYASFQRLIAFRSLNILLRLMDTPTPHSSGYQLFVGLTHTYVSAKKLDYPINLEFYSLLSHFEESQLEELIGLIKTPLSFLKKSSKEVSATKTLAVYTSIG